MNIIPAGLGLIALVSGLLFTSDANAYGLYGCFLFSMAALYYGAVRGQLQSGTAGWVPTAYAALMALTFIAGTIPSLYPTASLATSLVYGALLAGMSLGFYYAGAAALMLKILFIPLAVWTGTVSLLCALGLGSKNSYFGDSNTYATVLNLTFILALWLRHELREKRLAIYGTTVSAVLSLLGLYFVQSKGAWLALIATLVFLATVGWKRLAITRKHVAFIGIICLIALLSITTRVSGEINESRDGRSTNSRLALIVATFDIIKDNPLGVGIGQWAREYDKRRVAEDVESAGYRVHNDYLEVTAEAGPVGLAALLVPGIIALWAGLRIRRREDVNAQRTAALTALIAVCAGQAVVNYTFHEVSINLIVGLCCGLLLSEIGQKRNLNFGARDKYLLSTSFAVLSALATLAFVCFTAPAVHNQPEPFIAKALPWLKEEETLIFLKKVNPLEPRLDIAYAVLHYKKASEERLSVSERALSYDKAKATWLNLIKTTPDDFHLLATAGGMIKRLGEQFDPDYLNDAEPLLKRAHELAPAQSAVVLPYAELLFKKHRFDEAEVAVQLTLSRSAEYQKPLLREALTAIQSGRKKYE